MQRNKILREIKNVNQPSFIPTDVLRAHKGIAQQFKYKARNQNATDTDTARNSMNDTLYNLICNNRNNSTRKISIAITEHFSKPKEILNDRDLVDPVTGVIHKKVAISIPTNERIYYDKYHHSNVFTLYPRSSIRKLLDDLTTSLIQNREDNMARLEINPPSARSYIPTPEKLANQKAVINPKNNNNKSFLYSTGIFVFYDEIDMKNPSRVSKKSLKCCDRLNIDNINFPPTIKDIEQFEKDNLDIPITIFEYGDFHKIKEDDHNDENIKESIVIKDVGVSPYALKRKHLVELLIIKDNFLHISHQ